ncbi:Uncharacterised protein [Shigella sonnei]|nr:Uncharacterised protein [Shigella sonnei]SWE83785.1 Uncharacterised protein [Klebsiella pneumoniae]
MTRAGPFNGSHFRRVLRHQMTIIADRKQANAILL